MTTCIAATAWDGLKHEYFLVVTSDMKVSFSGHFSLEGVIKLDPIHGEWSAMVAGNDVSQAPFVIERAKGMLKGKKGKLLVVKNTFTRAYQEQLREVTTDELLSPFNMTLEEFKKKGRRELEPNLHQALSFGIKNAKLGCKFLIYGFDDDKIPHLFEVGEHGKVESKDKPGFWAIGNGATSAISMLAHLGQVSERTPLPETIYNVLAAKFISESASDVGTDTFAFIKSFGSTSFRYRTNFEKELRDLWNEKGRPKLPSEVNEIIARAQIEFE
jgi:hypothetical protein